MRFRSAKKRTPRRSTESCNRMAKEYTGGRRIESKGDVTVWFSRSVQLPRIYFLENFHRVDSAMNRFAVKRDWKSVLPCWKEMKSVSSPETGGRNLFSMSE
ncbi:hypothetical protein PUN28_016412 [Cardiocondyla obscurior]|uniref:Uncharacterized protein n=1 Tax=Cardiocondyla obscurior TaxID=286306 RepID=A0AAW2ER92_9HYME